MLLISSDLEEVAFKIFVRRLEEGKDSPSRNSIYTDLELMT